MKRFRITFNSPVVLGFILICFIVTLAGVLTGGLTTQVLFMTYRSSLTNPLTYLRLVTHVFGHSGWSHFLSNASYILILGPMLEEKYGSKRLVLVMLVTALATGLINFIFFPNIALCGASGIVFAMIMLASFTGFRDREIPLTAVLVAVIYIGQQVYEGITVDDNISNMAHIVGGIVGAVVGYVLNRNRD